MDRTVDFAFSYFWPFPIFGRRGNLEPFPIKWIPVELKNRRSAQAKMRKNKNLERYAFRETRMSALLFVFSHDFGQKSASTFCYRDLKPRKSYSC
jgi:hypothetical protein